LPPIDLPDERVGAHRFFDQRNQPVGLFLGQHYFASFKLFTTSDSLPRWSMPDQWRNGPEMRRGLQVFSTMKSGRHTFCCALQTTVKRFRQSFLNPSCALEDLIAVVVIIVV
jgi:hypothetical protein